MKKTRYRFIPINVYFPPMKTLSTRTMGTQTEQELPPFMLTLPLQWKNEFEIPCKIVNDNQLHVQIFPLWERLLQDPENMLRSVDQDRWISIMISKQFSQPKCRMTTIKHLFRALMFLFQNPSFFLCVDKDTGDIYLDHEGKEDASKKTTTTINIYRLQKTQ